MSEKEKIESDASIKPNSLLNKFFKGNDLLRIKKYLTTLVLGILLALGLIFFITINNQTITQQTKNIDKNLSVNF